MCGVRVHLHRGYNEFQHLPRRRDASSRVAQKPIIDLPSLVVPSVPRIPRYYPIVTDKAAEQGVRNRRVQKRTVPQTSTGYAEQ